jgi:hypothetical protein
MDPATMPPFLFKLEDKKVVACKDAVEWGMWFANANRRVQETLLYLPNSVRVSTVFIGINFTFNDDTRNIFETQVFGGDYDGHKWYYSTWELAEAGHDIVVEIVSERKKRVKK